MSKWFYMKGNAKYGPIDDGTLKQLASSGRVTPNDQVWREGLNGWVRAEQVKGLFGAPVSVAGHDEESLQSMALNQLASAQSQAPRRAYAPTQKGSPSKIIWIGVAVVVACGVGFVIWFVVAQGADVNVHPPKSTGLPAGSKEVKANKSDNLPTKVRTDAPANLFQKDPAASFKAYIARFIEVGKGLEKDSLRPDYSVDVRKTNSLISPYLGTADVIVLRKNETDGSTEDVPFKITFAAQDGKWALTGVEITGNVEPKNLSPAMRASFKDFLAVSKQITLDYCKKEVFERTYNLTQPNP